MKVDIGKYNSNNIKRKELIIIHAFDTWSLDHTLALVIVPALKKFREAPGGTPGGFVDHLKGKPTEKNWAAAHRRWLKIIDAMIWSFEQSLDETSGYGQYYTDGDFNKRKYNVYTTKIRKGLNYFAEYFDCLWN